MSFLLLITLLSTTPNFIQSIDIDYFFPFGTAHNDVVLHDLEQNIQLVAKDDAVHKVKTPHIPFFGRRNNVNMQVLFIFLDCLS